MKRRKLRCKVDVFYPGVALVKERALSADFSIWFGTLAVACNVGQGEKLLERDTLISFDNGEGGSVKLFPRRGPDRADAPARRVCNFYFVGTSPLLDLRSSGERKLLS